MRKSLIFLVFALLTLPAAAQDIVIKEGRGVGSLEIGQSYEQVQDVLGFHGQLKTYDDYLAEELFNEDPEDFLECEIGFDYYIKFEHLLTLPVSYVFFKDDKVNQIKVSSFPAYYFAIAKSTKTESGLHFWDTEEKMAEIYGRPALTADYENFIIKSSFYFRKGITFSSRDGAVRSAHLYLPPDAGLTEKFKSRFK